MPRIAFPTVEHVAALPILFRGVVRDDWIDVMGHMNVAWYTHVFAHAMESLFAHIGMPLHGAGSRRDGAFALESHVHYLAELHAGTRLRVHCRLLRRTEKRFHAMHFLVNEDAERLSATFEAVGAYVDLTTRRMAPFPKHIAAAADQLIAEHSALAWPAPVTGVMRP
jgi:acyl-CoA thioester hydrolase